MHCSQQDTFAVPTLLPPHEAERVAALHSLGLLDTPPEAAYDRITALAARLLGVPVALVTLVDTERQWFKSHWGMDMTETPQAFGFCAQAILSEGVTIVPDALLDPRFQNSPLVTGPPHIRFYARAPLHAPGGHRLGTLCVLDTQPRALSPEDGATLADLAAMVDREIALRAAAACAQDAGRALRAREQWFQSLAQNASDIITVLDAEGRVIYRSPSVAHVLGYLPEELVGRSLSETVHPEDQARVAEFFGHVRRTPGSHPPFTFRARHKEGRWRVLEAVSTNLLGDGVVGGIVVNARDVTERCEAENRLREANARLEALVQASPLAIFTFDAQGTVQTWNTAAERLFGWREAEAVGTFVPLAPPEELEKFRGLCARLMQGETFPNLEMACCTQGGARRDASVSCGPVRDASGQISGAVAIIADVSQSRGAERALARAEAKYRDIFENAVEGIFQTTRDGRCVSANPSLARILGYGSPHELMESVVDIATHLYAHEHRRAEFVQLMEEHSAVTDFVSQVYRKNGTLVWISENARAVRGDDGQTLYYEGTVEDITERKVLEAERAVQLADALQRADHDPLTGLLNHRAFHRALEQEADRALREGVGLAVAVLDLDNFKFFNDAYGHAVGDDVLRQIAGALAASCRSYDTLARFGGDEFALLMPGMDAAQAGEFAERLRARAQNLGFQPEGSDTVVPLGLSVGVAIFPEDGPGRLEALACADARLLRAKGGGQDEKTERLRAALTHSLQGFSILDALVTAVDNKDRYTRRHSEDVMRYSVATARQMGLDSRAQRTMEVAGLLHDVGKIGVPDSILRKPGKLSDEEYAAVQHHPLMGSIIVGSVPGFEDTLEAVRHHHERWDGCGYPFGLRGDQIPLLARIMAVADAYSAMTTDRPYRIGMNPEKALAILEEGAGAQWDPACIAAFVASQRAYLEARAACKDAEHALRKAREAHRRLREMGDESCAPVGVARGASSRARPAAPEAPDTAEDARQSVSQARQAVAQARLALRDFAQAASEG